MRYIHNIIVICLLTLAPASHANINPYDNLKSLIEAGRSEFKTMLEICTPSLNSPSCNWAQWRIFNIEQSITNHPDFPKDYRPNPLKNCIYAGAVACSLLGGPDPSEQGLTPLSSLTGQELTFPIQHHRKNPAESGAGGRDSD